MYIVSTTPTLFKIGGRASIARCFRVRPLRWNLSPSCGGVIHDPLSLEQPTPISTDVLLLNNSCRSFSSLESAGRHPDVVVGTAVPLVMPRVTSCEVTIRGSGDCEMVSAGAVDVNRVLLYSTWAFRIWKFEADKTTAIPSLYTKIHAFTLFCKYNVHCFIQSCFIYSTSLSGRSRSHVI